MSIKEKANIRVSSKNGRSTRVEPFEYFSKFVRIVMENGKVKPGISFFLGGLAVPSTRFRVIQYLNQGAIPISPHVNYSNFSSRNTGFNKILNGLKLLNMAREIAFGPSGEERVFIQRMLIYRDNVELEKMVFKRAKNGVLVDFDDAIFLKNPKFSYTVRNANLVIAGNEFLAEWASSFNSNVKVIPTSLDIRRFVPPPSREKAGPLVVGWTGTKDNVGYLRELVPSLLKLKKKYGFRVLIISDLTKSPGWLSGLGVEIVKWDEKKEVSQLWDIDIGLMPIPSNDWSKGKCGFKLLQYMATGSIAIGARVGVNEKIIIDGINGFLYEKQVEFEEKLDWVIGNYCSLNTITNNGRDTVVDRYSIQANSHAFFDAITNLQ